MTALSPSSGTAATTLPVTLTGTNFTSGATINAPSGITVSGVAVVSSTQMTASFAIAANATPGGYAITVTTANGTSGPVTFTVANSAAFTPIRVAGGSTTSYTDPLGQVWSADTGFNNGGLSNVTNPVNGSNAPLLYQNAHWGSAPGSPPTTFTATLPNGTYTVNLKFDENRFTQPGSRVFNIAINGQTVESNFDIFAAAGAIFTAVDRQYVVNVTTGQMVITFTPLGASSTRKLSR